ncbi:MAG TPA: hypothetical protein VM492_01120 [Sumerlaeia bacterium]|nr:hypothetical protein [Sumerlaeia bacterium]
MFVIANLDGERLRRLQEFEKEHDMRILALADMEVAPATIDAEQLAQLQALEKDLEAGTLLAVQ